MGLSNRGKKDINKKQQHNPEQKTKLENNQDIEFGHEIGDINASKYYEARAATEAEIQKAKRAKENQNKNS